MDSLPSTIYQQKYLITILYRYYLFVHYIILLFAVKINGFCYFTTIILGYEDFFDFIDVSDVLI